MVNGKLLLNVIVIVEELFPFPPTFSLLGVNDGDERYTFSFVE